VLLLDSNAQEVQSLAVYTSCWAVVESSYPATGTSAAFLALVLRRFAGESYIIYVHERGIWTIGYLEAPSPRPIDIWRRPSVTYGYQKSPQDRYEVG